MLTDGISADSVRGPAQRLKASGAEVFAVGLGRRFSYKQLAYMATDSRHIFKQDFTALARALKPMTRTVCKGEKFGGNHIFLNNARIKEKKLPVIFFILPT